MKRFSNYQQRRFRGANNNNWKKQQPQNTEESGFALQTDIESGAENLDETIVKFQQWQKDEEQACFAQFLEELDEEGDEEENC